MLYEFINVENILIGVWLYINLPTNLWHFSKCRNIGYFNFINCTYQLNETSTYYEGSTTDYDVPAPFYHIGGNLTIADSVWPRHEGVAPVTVKMVRLNNLINHLNNSEYGCGTKQDVTSWLVCNLD